MTDVRCVNHKVWNKQHKSSHCLSPEFILASVRNQSFENKHILRVRVKRAIESTWLIPQNLVRAQKTARLLQSNKWRSEIHLISLPVSRNSPLGAPESHNQSPWTECDCCYCAKYLWATKTSTALWLFFTFPLVNLSTYIITPNIINGCEI